MQAVIVFKRLILCLHIFQSKKCYYHLNEQPKYMKCFLLFENVVL